MATFEEFMKTERDRLDKEREALWTEIKEREDKVTAINKELEAITAYEAVKSGKAAPKAADAEKKRKGPAPGTPRATGGKARVLELIRANPNGISRPEIKKQLPDVGSVDNIVSALKKAELVESEGRGNPVFPKKPAA